MLSQTHCCCLGSSAGRGGDGEIRSTCYLSFIFAHVSHVMAIGILACVVPPLVIPHPQPRCFVLWISPSLPDHIHSLSKAGPPNCLVPMPPLSSKQAWKVPDPQFHEQGRISLCRWITPECGKAIKEKWKSLSFSHYCLSYRHAGSVQSGLLISNEAVANTGVGTETGNIISCLGDPSTCYHEIAGQLKKKENPQRIRCFYPGFIVPTTNVT